jgi:integrase
MMAFAVTDAVMGSRHAMKLAKKLSPAVVESHKPEAQPYRVWDTTVPQLFLRVQPSGVKSWNVQCDRATSRALGKWPAVTVDAARLRARKLLTETEERGAPPDKVKDTVADACRDYVAWLKAEGRTAAAKDAERRFERTVYSDPLGKIRLQKLAQDDMEDWRSRVERGELAKLPTRKGRPPEAKPLGKGSVNRMRTPLVAALNRAVSRRKVTPDRAIEWESVKPFKNADKRRDLYLEREQRRALLANAGEDVRAVMECVALTGCRPGDPAAVLRRDYDAKHGTVTFRTKEHPRNIPLSPAAKALFDRLAKDKLPNAHLFTNGGASWDGDWSDLVKEAAIAAGLPANVVLYTLRHCWITDAIVGGMDLLTVARLTGTSLAMIEKHYGQLVEGAAREKLATVNFL